MEIAKLVGYKSTPGPANDDSEATVIWLAPRTKTPTRIPRFTTSLDDAKALAELLVPQHIAGVTYGHEDYCSAGVNDSRANAATPAIALCMAAFIEYRNRKTSNGD